MPTCPSIAFCCACHQHIHVLVEDVDKGTCMQITSLLFSPDGQMLLSGDAEGKLILWSLKEAKRVATFHDHRAPIWALAFSHGSSSMLASGEPMHHSEWMPRPFGACC